MAKNFKGEEIEVGDVVSINFNVTEAHSENIQLERVTGGVKLFCRAASGEISIIKKVEKPLAIGDFIECRGRYGPAVRPKTHQIIAFDADECVYKRSYCDGSFSYDHAPTISCKRDLR